jgi:hypothetical protein
MGEARRQYQPVDLLEFKRRLQARVESASTSNEDPLAELARIIGGGGRIVPADVPSHEEASFGGGQMQAAGRAREPSEPIFEPVHQATEDRSWDHARLEPAFGGPADFQDAAEEEWQRLAPPEYYANEDLPEPTSRAYLRLRNRRRRNLSLYTTVAAAVVVAGLLVVVFTRPGVSVGIAPAAHTAAAIPALPPADTGPAPASVPAAAIAPADVGAGVQLAAVPSPQPAGDSSVAAVPAAPLAQSGAPPPAAAAESPFSQPRRVQTIPIYSDGSFIDPVAPNPNGDQFGAAPDSAATPFTEPQILQMPASSPPAPPAPAATDTATPAAAGGAGKQVAALAPPKAAPAPAIRTTSAGDAAETFAAVLASPAAESDARNMLGQLQKKYGAALGGHRLTYHRVKRAEGVVYEVRVAGLGNDDAQSLCAKLSKAGASCDVGSQ